MNSPAFQFLERNLSLPAFSKKVFEIINSHRSGRARFALKHSSLFIMNTITINGTPRNGVGKKATKADRNSGKIPCVLYGHDVENIHFTTTGPDIRSLIYSGEFQIAEINLDGKSHRCILKQVQYHPVTDKVAHIDFMTLTSSRPLQLEVPLRFTGSSPGVRTGGKFIQKLRTVKIKTTLEKMVDSMSADISTMELGGVIRVKDIQPTDGVEIINPLALPIASITVPRGLKEAATAAATPAGGGKKKK